MRHRRRRRRARENPLTTNQKMLIGLGGATLLGTIIYLATRPKKDTDQLPSGDQTPQQGAPPSGEQKMEMRREIRLPDTSSVTSPSFDMPPTTGPAAP